jgi:serine/threonine protein kinase/tetratricopeptide (TPR) repeat protein
MEQDFEHISAALNAQGINLEAYRHYLNQKLSTSSPSSAIHFQDISLEIESDSLSSSLKISEEEIKEQDSFSDLQQRAFLPTQTKASSPSPSREEIPTVLGLETGDTLLEDTSQKAEETKELSPSFFVKPYDSLPTTKDLKKLFIPPKVSESSSKEDSQKTPSRIPRKSLDSYPSKAPTLVKGEEPSTRDLPQSLMVQQASVEVTPTVNLLEMRKEGNPEIFFVEDPQENERFIEVMFRLLLHSKVQLAELNRYLKSLDPKECNVRSFLQQLLKENKIRIDECLDWEQGKWPVLPQQVVNPYGVRLDKKGRGEFYLDPQYCEKVFGHYYVLQELARGGMGIVYKAYHPFLEQYFALKVLIAGESASEDAIKRFHREAQSTARLKHPGIIQIMDSGQVKGEHYFVMEFIEGNTLGKLIKKKLPVSESVSLLKQALEALDFAHKRGVLHRDLKPENIFVTLSGEPKIGDFGLAKDFHLDAKNSKLTHSGAIIGTPAYMSPEQASGEIRSLDERADIYSMGACLYQALTGKPPFESESLHDLLYQVIYKEAQPPSYWNPEISKDLDTIVMKALAKAKVKRYPSAIAFAEDLGRYLAGYSISAKPLSLGEHLYKKLWPYRFFFGVPLSLLLGSFLAFIPLQNHYKKEIQLREERSLRQEIQKKQDYQQSLQIAKQLQNELLFLENEALRNDKKKWNLLLQTLQTLERALSLSPEETQVWNDLEKTLRSAFPLAYHFKQYRWVDTWINQIEQGLQNSSWPSNTVEKILDSLQNLHEELQETQKKRFEKILDILKNEISLENSLRESLQRELLTLDLLPFTPKLLESLKQGLDFFIQTDALQSHDLYFYETIVLLCGELPFEDAYKPLSQGLKELQTNYTHKTLTKNLVAPRAIYEYLMVALLRSLIRLQPPPSEHSFLTEIREAMGKGSLFWEKTSTLYSELPLPLSSLENPETQEKNPPPLEDPQLLNASNNNSSTPHKNPEETTHLLTSTPQGIAWFEKGQKSFEQKRYQEALDFYEKALEADNTNAYFYESRGRTYLEMGKNLQAQKDFEQAIQLQPGIAYFYESLALLYLRQNAFEEAYRLYQGALQRDPSNGDFHLTLGKLAYNQGISEAQNSEKAFSFFRKALEHYEKALQFGKKGAVTWNNRGLVLLNLGEEESALKDFKQALQLDKNFVAALYNLTIIYQNLQDWDNALEHLEQAITLQSNPQAEQARYTFLFQRARQSYEEKKYKKAKEDLLRLRKEAPSDHPVREEAQQLWEAIKNKAK